MWVGVQGTLPQHSHAQWTRRLLQVSAARHERAPVLFHKLEMLFVRWQRRGTLGSCLSPARCLKRPWRVVRRRQDPVASPAS